MKVFGLLVAAILAAGFGSIGCGGDEESPAEGSGGDGQEVQALYLLPTLEDESYVREKAGAEAEARKHPNADFEFAAGSGRLDAADLIARIETALTQRVDVIAVDAGGTAKQLRPALQRAISQDVDVVAVGQPIPGLEGISSTIRFDDRKANIAAGRFIAEELPEGAKITIVRCVIGNAVTDAREDGFREGLEAADPTIEVVARGDAKCLPAEARSFTENTLSAHPDLKGIYSDTDVAVIGSLEALEATGKDMVVVGHDGQEAAVERIANGHILDATVRFSYEDTGRLAVQTAVQVAQGENVPAMVPVPVFPLITEDNAVETLQEINAAEE